MSFVTVTVNLPGAQSWDRAGSRAPPDCSNLSQSSASPAAVRERERDRAAVGLHAVHLLASFKLVIWSSVSLI